MGPPCPRLSPQRLMLSFGSLAPMSCFSAGTQRCGGRGTNSGLRPLAPWRLSFSEPPEGGGTVGTGAQRWCLVALATAAASPRMPVFLPATLEPINGWSSRLNGWLQSQGHGPMPEAGREQQYSCWHRPEADGEPPGTCGTAGVRIPANSGYNSPPTPCYSPMKENGTF